MARTPTSAAGSKLSQSQRGFTLIEMMIVVLIIGLATAAAVWAMPDPRGRLADEAVRLAARAQAARDTAIITARPVSLWISRDGYGFDERADGQWRAMADKPFRVTQWGEGTTALVGPARERIVYDSTGLADRPARITLSRGQSTAAVTIAADGRAQVAR